jgi:hypothetical protein
MFAELQFPAGAVSAWKKLTLDESTYADDTDDQWIGTSGKEGTVAELLADIAEHQEYSEKTRGVDWLDLVVSGDKVTFRAMINEDDFRYWQGIVGNVLRIAEKVSARGEYVVVANDDMVGARVVLDGEGGSRVEEFSLSELLGGEEEPEDGAIDYATIVEEMFAKMSAKLDSLTKKPAEEKKKAAPKKKAAAKKKAAPTKKAAAKKKAAPTKKAATKKKAAPTKKAAAKKKGAKKKR